MTKDQAMIHTLMKENDELKLEIGRLRETLSHYRWIPVRESFPEDGKTIMVSTDTGGIYPEARFSKEDGWEWAYESGADYWVSLTGVKAWMPLPEPYKEEGE